MHTFFGRFEWVEKDELFPSSRVRHSVVYGVSKLTGGYIFDVWKSHPLAVGVGGSVSLHLLPADLELLYGERPTSYNIFSRFKLQ